LLAGQDRNGNGNGAHGAGDAPRLDPAPAPSPDHVIRRALKEKTERIPLRALERRGFRSVQVLDMATIERIVHEAVDHCLAARREEPLGADERARLEADAKQEFLKLLAEHKKVVAQKTEIERAREALSRQVDTLREELAKQQDLLRSERDRKLAGSTFRLSPESFAEMETKIRKLFDQLVARERRVSLAEVGPQALRGLSELEREIAVMLDRLIGEQREKLFDREKREHEAKVDLLERRIEKLNKALADTEGALRQVMAAKSIDPGIASIYDSVQGLALDALNFERKKELLREVFLENLTLQGRKIEEEDRVAFPIERPAAPPVPPAPEDLGFEPPLEPLSGDVAF
jgi:hypothetical protein